MDEISGLAPTGAGLAARGTNFAVVSVGSTIIAGNPGNDVEFLAGTGANSIFSSGGYNLIGDGNAVGGFAQPGDQKGVADPMLGPLAWNGGPTMTHAVLAGSAALDAGNPSSPAPSTYDQRGAPFERIADGDGVGGARIDIGSYERQTVPGLSLIVDTLVDESDGNYDAGDLSLREAIGLANGSLVANTITFAASLTSGGAATIPLTLGELRIVEALTINGPGADRLTIDASGNDPTPTVNNGDGSRVFHVDDGTVTALVVAISGLALTGGDMGNSGGAIRNTETLTLTALTISGNAAGTTTVGYHGGGIANSNGNLTIIASTISGNTTSFGRGGAIYSSFGNLTINHSTISGNTATSTGSGGGIYSSYTPTAISSSTISGNSANTGGGIAQSGIGVVMTITNSTVSGNSARVNGGGVVALYSDLNVRHSTITGNRSDADNNSTGNGGGVAVISAFSHATIDHTVVAGNLRSVSTRSDIFGSLAARYSLIGDNTGATITDNGGNQIGTGATPINPLLGPLADNGGPTMTHKLLSGSPAIDAGDPAAVAGVGNVPLYDQRLAALGRVFDGDGAGGARIDIGALELQPIPPAAFGDYNQNGVVDAADYVIWRKQLGTNVTPGTGADGVGDGVVDSSDYGAWRTRFGNTVPPGAGSVEQGAGSGEEGAKEFRIADFGLRMDQGMEPGGGSREKSNRALRIAHWQLSEPARWQDHALAAWVASRTDGEGARGEDTIETFGRHEGDDGSHQALLDALDSVFERLLVGAA